MSAFEGSATFVFLVFADPLLHGDVCMRFVKFEFVQSSFARMSVAAVENARGEAEDAIVLLGECAFVCSFLFDLCVVIF